MNTRPGGDRPTRIRHIAVVAPPWYPLPPVGYGGTELVVHLLVSSLRRAGVRVTLYGCEGSAPGTTVMAEAGWSEHLGQFEHAKREVTYGARTLDHLATLDDVDLIHDHAEWLSTAMCSFSNIAPVVHTVHGVLDESRITAYESLGKRTHLVAISKHQHDARPDLNWWGMVHNAVDIDNLHVATPAEKEGYLLCMARITPEKGQHLAIMAARHTGKRLILAGKVGELPGDSEYFHTQVMPHVDDDQVRYIANVAGDEKTRVLAHADALLHPVTFPEPFGLAMVEAMASGTPCIAMSMGAASELVTHGTSGFLCTTLEGLIDGINHCREIDPAACAATVRTRFHPDRMAREYMAVYERVLWATSRSSPLLDLTGSQGRKAARAAVLADATTPGNDDDIAGVRAG